MIGSGLVSLKTLALPFDALGDATKIIGSGALRGDQRDAGPRTHHDGAQGLRLGVGRASPEGRANLDSIKYVVTPEDSVRIGALLAGQAQVIRQVQAYDEKQVQSKNYLIYAAADPWRKQQRRVPSRQSAGRRTSAGAPGAAAASMPRRSCATLFLGQLSAGQVDHRLDGAGLRRSSRPSSPIDPASRCQAARRGRLDGRSEGAAPEGRQGELVLMAYKIAAAAAGRRRPCSSSPSNGASSA